MHVRIDQYTQQTLPTGSVNSEMPAGAFGADQAQGIENLAHGAEQFDQDYNMVQMDQGRVWAATAVSRKELQLQSTFQQRVNSLDPSDPQYPQKIASITQETQDDVNQATSDLVDAAPGRFAKRFTAYHMASAGLRLNDLAMRTQSQLNGDYTKNLVQDGIKADSDILAATPDNDTYGRLLQKQHDAIVGMQTISPELKSALLGQAAQTYANVQVSSLVAKDPQSFLQLVNAQGGSTTARGGVKGAVPTVPGADAAGGAQTPAQPEMLAFANTQIAAGKSPEDAMRAVTDKYPDQADKFAFAFKNGQFTDLGTTPTPQDPQVQPLNDQDIAKAEPPIAGWDKLTWPQKVAYVRQAEGQVGKQLASDRGAITRELQDARATLLAGQNYPGLDTPRYSQANLEHVLGPDEGARAAQTLSYDQQVGQFMQSVSTMPAAQRDATLSQLAPAGGEGFAAAEPAYKAAQEAAKRVAAAQVKTPIQYAIEAGIGGAQPIDFTKPLQDQLVARAKVANTMQRDYGAKPQIFTDTEVKALADDVGKLAPNQRINLLENIRQGLNDPQAFGQAMHEFAPKNPNLAYAANLAAIGKTSIVDGKPVSDTDIATDIATGDIILNGRKLDQKAGPDGDPAMPTGSQAVKFDDTGFQSEFQRSLAGAFTSPDAQRTAATQTDVYNAVKAYYVAQAYKQGKPLNVVDPKGVANAIQAVVGAPWAHKDGVLLAPHGMPIEQFQSQWNGRANAALTAAGYSADDASRILSQTRPINLADGRYGFQNGTKLQTDARGRPIVVDYTQPYTPPGPFFHDFDTTGGQRGQRPMQASGY